MRAALFFAAGTVLLAQEMPVEERRTIQKTLSAKRLEVDNVNGYVHVTGYDGKEIEATVEEIVRGESKDRIADAHKDVKLDITQPSDMARMYVDGPFRCHCSDGWRHYGYRVTYNFDIKAPLDTVVYLRTVNQGDLKVDGIAGDYDLSGVNVPVELLEASGSGRAYSVNGAVRVVFRSNPRAASTFGSLNGRVDLYFQPDLAADLRMKTFNGKFYTDFEITPLPPRQAAAERRDGKLVYRADRYTSARVGAGGPEITFDGFNGDVHILKREK